MTDTDTDVVGPPGNPEAPAPVQPIRSVTGRPVVFLHIGEPKTATTAFQQMLWDNRPAVATRGVDLAGLTPVDSFRGMQDLRDVKVEADHPTGSWAGEWDVLAEQAVRASRVGVISQESISGAGPAQVRRAAASLADGELHVVISVRDFASLLPAEWQETVKHRSTSSWPEFVERIRRREPRSGSRPAAGFWRVHDTPELLRTWSQVVPVERIHIVTMPRPSSPPELLWRRMAGLLDLLDVPIDVTASRRNSSLGYAEVEYLRQLNQRLRGQVPNWFYMEEVKQAIAHEIFLPRSSARRATLTPAQWDWAATRADTTIDLLRASGAHVVGDLDELRPVAPSSAVPAATTSPQEQTEIAVAALTGLVQRNYELEVQETTKALAGATAIADLVRSNPAVERLLRGLTRRRGLGRWGRTLLWRANERRLLRRARSAR